MRILVTGGAGFVGSSLCLKIKEAYPTYSVIALDNLKRRGSELNLRELREADIEFLHGDIRCPEDLDTLTDIDVMIEASAEPSVLAGLDRSPTGVINNNLVGSLNCFDLCLKNKARLIFLSSSRIYPIDRIENASFVEEATRFSFASEQAEPGISELGISEELNLAGPRSFYGASKLASELFIEEYVQFYGLQAAVIRYGVIAGPRQMGRTDQGVVTLWMAKHYWQQPLSYIGYGGSGKQVRDILHIDDLFELVNRQIHDPSIFQGKVFNAGGGLSNSISLQELTTLCERITGLRTNIGLDPVTRPADLRCYVTDNSKLEAASGWSPRKNVETVLTDIFNWIKANEKALRPILS